MFGQPFKFLGPKTRIRIQKTSNPTTRSIDYESHSSETLDRTITWNDQGQQSTNSSNVRSASATGSADAFYHRQWENHWWLGQETWTSHVQTFCYPASATGISASGGTWQNATYDDYNY